MLEVRDLDVRYGGIHAIRGVSLRIPTGQVVALVGRNGAGKSSLVRAVGGVLRPAGGQVRLNDTDITGWPPHRIARAGLVLVFEERRIFGGLSVRENLLVGLRRPRAQRQAALDRVYEVLLLDEPTLGLAPVIVEDVFRAIQKLSATGQTVLLVEQNALLAVELASYVYVLSRGKIVSKGQSSDYDDSVLTQAYL